MAPRKKLTIMLPPDLITRGKRAAFEAGTSLSQIIEKGLIDQLAVMEKKVEERS